MNDYKLTDKFKYWLDKQLSKGTASIIPANPVPGDKLSFALGGEAYTLQQKGKSVSYAWQRSDDGETGWYTFTGGPYTVGASSVNKYLRARISIGD